MSFFLYAADVFVILHGHTVGVGGGVSGTSHPFTRVGSGYSELCL